MKPLITTITCIMFMIPITLLGVELDGWNLEWSDEFDQSDGSLPDSTKWSYNIGTGENGWGNGESQYYTDRANNARVENGQLLIEMHKENYLGSPYTSARLLTQGTYEFQYGRIEARLKVPNGLNGLWPAFWMLGSNIDSVGWPQCGEIDVMEYISREPYEIFGTIHGPGYSGGDAYGSIYTLNELVSDEYHTFTVEWDENLIKWFIDGQQYHMATPDSLPGKQWVFNDPQFLILNLAIGGNFGGSIDPTITFPQQYWIDYVRVYSRDGSDPVDEVVELVNGGFEDAVLSPWVGFIDGNANTQGGYIEDTSYTYYSGNSNVLTHSGENVAKVFGGFNGQENINGFYQDINVKEETRWQVSAWALTHPQDLMVGNNTAWIDATFRDVNNNILALYQSEILTSTSVTPGEWMLLETTNQLHPTTYAWIGTTSEMVAPQGTTKLRLQANFRQLAGYDAGSMYFDDFSLIERQGDFELIGNYSNDYYYISFPTLSGYQYQVYNSSSVDNTSWSAIETLSGDGMTNTVFYPAGSGQRFYKIIRN